MFSGAAKLLFDAICYRYFIVDVYVNGVKHVIEKRYSEFEELHKTLKKEISVPYFPPKKVLNKSTKFIEERRSQLEAYLQHILKTSEYTAALLTFLNISQEDTTDGNASNGVNDSAYNSSSFNNDQLSMCPFGKSDSSIDQVSHSNSASPDIILQGIYRTMYAT
ncbi:SNX24 [Bugula neritina]|uniref:SNX24 n=1 Tax=Bugula neritina TaxID=10212 RepID=A0A7J7KRH0_BUGNE|nr:SNX24 [Bugula neritina]